MKDRIFYILLVHYIAIIIVGGFKGALAVFLWSTGISIGFIVLILALSRIFSITKPKNPYV